MRLGVAAGLPRCNRATTEVEKEDTWVLAREVPSAAVYLRFGDILLVRPHTGFIAVTSARAARRIELQIVAGLTGGSKSVRRIYGLAKCRGRRRHQATPDLPHFRVPPL
jgi:hypothetical protein